MLERILAVEWRGDVRKSHSLLLQEHFRRMALWAKALDVVDGWCCFDVALHIDSSTRANPDDLQRLVQHFKRINFLNPMMEGLLKYSLHWDLAKDLDAVKQYRLPFPYEPVIVMFERHGCWWTHHGYTVNSDGSMFILRSREHYSQAEPYLTSLNKDILDVIDADNHE